MLTARQVLALACHAELSIIRWSDGIPLDVGRRYRTETPAIRRALEARDQGCRAPGCSMPAAWCTAHHLKPWSQGGTTSLQDTALFCFVHHNYFIHLLGWTITGDPQRHPALHPPPRLAHSRQSATQRHQTPPAVSPARAGVRLLRQYRRLFASPNRSDRADENRWAQSPEEPPGANG